MMKQVILYWIELIDDLQGEIAGVYKVNEEIMEIIRERRKTSDSFCLFEFFDHYMFKNVISDISRKRLIETYFRTGARCPCDGACETPGETILAKRWKKPKGIIKAMPVFLFEVGLITMLALVKNMLKVLALITPCDNGILQTHKYISWSKERILLKKKKKLESLEMKMQEWLFMP